jgi:hypothetical protein
VVGNYRRSMAMEWSHEHSPHYTACSREHDEDFDQSLADLQGGRHGEGCVSATFQ